MKVLLLTLLLLLSSTQVLTLECHVCYATADICDNPQTCPDTANHCMVLKNADETVTHSCAETCQENDDTTCCEENLCNSS